MAEQDNFLGGFSARDLDVLVPDDKLTTMPARVKELETRVAELEEDKRRLGNLLARIHRDGGHYEQEHGTAKAWADADKIVVDLFSEIHPRIRELEDALRPFAQAWDNAISQFRKSRTLGVIGAVAAYYTSGVHFRNARWALWGTTSRKHQTP